MAEAASLLDVVREICPGTRVDAFQAGKYFVVGFHRRGQSVWTPLDVAPDDESVENVLGCVANMLVCCGNCDGHFDWRCHHEHRLMATKLRGFLGPDGFNRFLKNAPIARPSPLAPQS